MIAALCLMLAAQWPEKAVEVGERVAEVSSVLADWTEQTGQQFRATPELGREIVYLRGEKQKLQEVAPKLADVLDAEFTWDGRAWRLARPKAVQQAHQRSSLSLLRSSIQEGLAQLALKASRMTPYERSKELAGRFSSGATDIKSPYVWLAEDLLARIGVDRLAELPLGVPIAWSDKPSRRQKALPVTAHEVITRFQETERHLATLLEDLPVPSPLNGWQRSLLASATAPEPKKFILLTVRLQSSIWTLVASYTSTGSMRGMGGATVPLPPEEVVAGDLVVRGNVTLSSRSQQWYALGKKLPEKRLFPRQEPLSFGAKEFLDAIASKLDAPSIVARVPDEWESIIDSTAKSGAIDLAQVLPATQQDGAKFEVQKGWLLVRHTRPWNPEAERVPRAEMEKLAARAEQEGFVSVRGLGLFRYGLGPSPYQTAFASKFRQKVVNAQAVEGDPPPPEAVLDFVGSVPEPIWARLVRGEEVSANALPIPSRDRIDLWANVSLRAILRTTPSEVPEDIYLSGSEAFALWPIGGASVSLRPATRPLIRFSSSEARQRLAMPEFPVPVEFVRRRLADLLRLGTIGSLRDLEAETVDCFTAETPALVVGISQNLKLEANLPDRLKVLAERVPLRSVPPDFQDVLKPPPGP